MILKCDVAYLLILLNILFLWSFFYFYVNVLLKLDEDAIVLFTSLCNGGFAMKFLVVLLPLSILLSGCVTTSDIFDDTPNNVNQNIRSSGSRSDYVYPTQDEELKTIKPDSTLGRYPYSQSMSPSVRIPVGARDPVPVNSISEVRHYDVGEASINKGRGSLDAKGDARRDRRHRRVRSAWE